MANLPTVRIAHLPITDHIILGQTKSSLDSGTASLSSCQLELAPKGDWASLSKALEEGTVDGAFILAPIAMDMFKSGLGIKLVLFTHRNGSILVRNSRGGVNGLEDFKHRSVLIPYQLSVHNMLFHKLLAEQGLTLGVSDRPDVDVVVEIMAPGIMPEVLGYDDLGEIAGFIVAEPIGSQAVAAGNATELQLSKEIWPEHPCCVFVVRDELIENNEDAVYELTRHLVEAGTYIQNNPVEAAEQCAPFLKQPVEIVRNVLTDPPDRITTDRLAPSIEDLSIMQDYMHDVMHVLKNKTDLEQLVVIKYAQAAGAK